jgi:hypothetical protein
MEITRRDYRNPEDIYHSSFSQFMMTASIKVGGVSQSRKYPGFLGAVEVTDVIKVVGVSGQVTHFNISGISRRAGLHFLADGFAFFAVGAHEFVVKLEVHPHAGGDAEEGGC